MKHVVRTTMNPSKTIEVDEPEFTDLRRWDLLVSDDTSTEAPAPEDNPTPEPSTASATGTKK